MQGTTRLDIRLVDASRRIRQRVISTPLYRQYMHWLQYKYSTLSFLFSMCRVRLGKWNNCTSLPDQKPCDLLPSCSLHRSSVVVQVVFSHFNLLWCHCVIYKWFVDLWVLYLVHFKYRGYLQKGGDYRGVENRHNNYMADMIEKY